MNRRLFASLLLLLALGCDRTHPARPVAERFAEALRYGDVEGMLALHADGTDSSRWCREEFRTALRKAHASIDAEECQRIRSIGEHDLDRMNDELRLAVQLTGWVCEHPDGTCQGYAETVFRQALEGDPLITGELQAVTVRKVFGDEGHAAAYVDITDGSGETSHRTLQLDRIGDSWRVSAGLLDEPTPAPTTP